MFWSVPVITGWVFAAKYLATLAKGNRYPEIDFHDSILHLFGQARRIEKWTPVSSHLGFNESQFAELMSENHRAAQALMSICTGTLVFPYKALRTRLNSCIPNWRSDNVVTL